MKRKAKPISLKGMNSDIREIVEAAIAQGWRAERRPRARHVRLLGPDGTTQFVVPSTPSDWRSCKNARATAKRNGIVV